MTQALSRDLNYRLTADPTRMDKGFKSAEQSARVFERELAKLEAAQRRVDQASTKVGQGLLAAGAAIAAGLFVATRAAVRWESQWAGVVKAIEGTPAQLAALEGELRELSRTLRVSDAHQQVTAVAEAAGQLGVRRQDIAAFTKTMIDMGISTNLSATDAADAIARMSNIMGTAPNNVRRLASTIVALGNDGASTEAEILAMALRIAGAGKTIGLTEANVLAFANSLSSVGIEAEAGGSSISRVFIRIASAVRHGGDELDIFAKVAGGTAAQFKAAYQQDAAAAIDAFIKGLGRMQRSGGDVFAVLDALDLKEIRVRDALLRLAAAGDLTTHSLEVGSRAWQDNIALTEEANRRYDTAAARLDGAKNRLNDFAISMGQTFLPIVAKGADVVGFLADAANSLPGPVKAAAAVVGLFAAALLLTGGAALLAVPKINAARQAIETLRNSTSTAAAATGRVAGVLTGPWGLAIAGAITVVTMFAAKQAALRAATQELAGTFDEQTSAITESTRVMVAHRLQEQGMAEWAEFLGLNLATLTDVVLGDADAIATFQAAIAKARAETTDNALPALESFIGGVEAQRRGFSDASKTANELREATQGATDATSKLPPAQRKLADALNLTATQAQSAGKEIENLDKELKGLFETMFGVEEAQDALASAWNDLTEKVNANKEAHDKNAVSLAGNSKTAIENRAAVRDLVSLYGDMIVEQAKAGATTDELTAAAAGYKAELIKQLMAMGFARADAVLYAAALDKIPDAVATTIQTPGMDTAIAKATNLIKILNKVPSGITITPRFGQIIGFQHGGAVHGPPGPDRVPSMLTAGEFVSTAMSTRTNRAALEAANSGARLAVAGTAQPAVTGSAAAGPTAGGDIEVRVFIGEQELRGVIRTEVREHDRQTIRRAQAGTGRRP